MARPLNITLGSIFRRINNTNYYVITHDIHGTSSYLSHEDKLEYKKPDGKLTKETKDAWTEQISKYLTEKDKRFPLVNFNFNDNPELRMPKKFMDEFIEELKMKFSDFRWEIECDGYSNYSLDTYLQQVDEHVLEYGIADCIFFENGDIIDGKLDAQHHSVVVLWKCEDTFELVGENIKRVIVV